MEPPVMIVASGSGPIVPMGPTGTHIVAGLLIAVSALIVLGYYGTKLQWWLQDRRKAKGEHSADRHSSEEV
jgi:hypothetical protein